MQIAFGTLISWCGGIMVGPFSRHDLLWFVEHHTERTTMAKIVRDFGERIC
jgi:hypothetical protein